MALKHRANIAIAFMLVAAAILEMHFIISFLNSPASSAESLENVIITGLLTAIIIALSVLLMRQDAIARKLKTGSAGPGDSRKLRKDLRNLYSEKGAIEILFRDSLLGKAEYAKSRDNLEKRIEELKKQLREMKAPGA